MRRIAIISGLMILAALPALAAGETLPAGEIIGGGGAMVGKTVMPRGAMIFSGDLLKGGNQSAYIQLADKGKMELFPNASVQVLKTGNAVQLNVQSGKAAFYFPKGSQSTIRTPRGAIRLVDTTDRFYGLVEVGPGAVVVQSFQGSLSVTNEMTDETATVKPGYSANMTDPTASSGAGSPSGRGLIDLTSGKDFTEDFDLLSKTGKANPWMQGFTINGFYSLFGSTTYIADDGNSTESSLYSYGHKDSSDRAIGSVCSGPPIYHGARFLNSTGKDMKGIKIGYVGEQWRNGGNPNPQKIDFQYRVVPAGTKPDIRSGDWTDFDALDFTSPVHTDKAGPLDGNAMANREIFRSKMIKVKIPAGDEIWIRWVDSNNTGKDHGLAVDELDIVPVFFFKGLYIAPVAAGVVTTIGLWYVTRDEEPESPSK